MYTGPLDSVAPTANPHPEQPAHLVGAPSSPAQHRPRPLVLVPAAPHRLAALLAVEPVLVVVRAPRAGKLGDARAPVRAAARRPVEQLAPSAPRRAVRVVVERQRRARVQQGRAAKRVAARRGRVGRRVGEVRGEGAAKEDGDEDSDDDCGQCKCASAR